MDARYVNELGNTSRFTTDRFGNLTSFTAALGAKTVSETDDIGRIFRITEADPDGAGSQTSPVTKLGYDAKSNLVVTVNPDTTTVKAEYDATLNRVTKLYNELNKYDTIEYFTDGDLKSWTDALGNKWQYTYDAYGNLLTETTPDPDGAGSLQPIVTTYEYHATYHNRLTKVTWGDSTYRSFTHTSRDEVASFTNELGHVTSYVYDPLGRMLTMTLPDPDGAGSQTSPVYTWAYGSNLQASSHTDPLNNVTSYTWDVTGRMTKVTLPDPDGAGSLTAPEYVYTYNFLGQVTAEVRPQFNSVSIAYTYDANGRLTTVTGPLSGQTTSYSFDALDRLTQTADASGRTVNYVYDSRYRLTSMVDHDPDGAGPKTGPTTSWQYDAASQVTGVTNALGRTTTVNWLDNGWLDKYTLPDPDGSGSGIAQVHKYTHDNLGRVTKHTDPANRETKYVYDARHRITRITTPDPDGPGPNNPLQPTNTDYAYNAAGWLTSITEPMSRVTSFTYDNLGRTLTKTLPDPDGAGSQTSPVYSWTYDAASNMATATDARGAVTAYAYDNLYRVTSVTLPDPDGAGSQTSPVWSYTYTSRTLLDKVTDPLSKETSYGHDAAGRNTTITDPLGNVTTIGLDVLDRVVSLTEPDPDGAGSQTAAVTNYTYDIYSRVTQIQDPNSGTIDKTYDLIGQLIRLEDQSGNSTSWAYDDLGRVTLETDELGNTRSFYYNDINRLVRKMDREGRTTQYGYQGYTETELWYAFSGAAPVTDIVTTTQGTTGTNEVQTVTLQNTSSGVFMLGFDGQTTSPIAWDATAADVETALEALPAIDDVTVTKSGSTWTVTFGGNLAETDVSSLQGAVALINDGDFLRTITRVYNEAFFLTSASDSTGAAAYTYTVDALGRNTKVVENMAGLTTNATLDHKYDASGNRTETTVSLSTEMFPEKDYKTTWAYDNLNRVTTISQTKQTGGHAVADKTVKYTYNGRNQVTDVNRYANLTGTGAALRSVLGYDNAGRLTSLDHQDVASGGGATLLHGYDFIWDNASRITGIDSSLDGVSSFTLDKLGQLKTADHAAGRTDESYSFDSTGNRTGGDYTVTTKNRTTASTGYTYQYDKEGNRTKRTKTSDNSYELYSWDHRNRLTKVRFYNSSDVLVKEIDYTYDMFNRMVGRKLDSNGSGSGGVSNIYWAGFEGINPTLEFDGMAATDVSHRYLWGIAADELLADEVVTTTSSNGVIQWALSDQVGSIRDIAKWDTATSKFVIANHRVYNSFGVLESETNTAIDLSFGYTGKWTETETGYTYHWNRWYDVGIGKWISEDPIGFAGGDTNISRYVGNRVLTGVDSNGLEESMPRSAPVSTGAGSGEKYQANQDEGDQDDDTVHVVGPIWIKGKPEDRKPVEEAWNQIQSLADADDDDDGVPDNSDLNTLINEIKSKGGRIEIEIVRDDDTVAIGSHDKSQIDAGDVESLPDGHGPKMSKMRVVLHEFVEQITKSETKSRDLWDNHLPTMPKEAMLDGWTRTILNWPDRGPPPPPVDDVHTFIQEYTKPGEAPVQEIIQIDKSGKVTVRDLGPKK